MIAIEAIYQKLQVSKETIATSEFAQLAADLCRVSLQLLKEEGEPIPLISLVPGKSYFAFRRTIITGKHEGVIRVSRPVKLRAIYWRYGRIR